MDEKNRQDEPLAPDLEEFFEEAPNPKEVREEVQSDFEEGKEEALDLRQRIGKIIEERSNYSGLDYLSSAELLEKALDNFAKNFEDSVNFFSAAVLGAAGKKGTQKDDKKDR